MDIDFSSLGEMSVDEKGFAPRQDWREATARDRVVTASRASEIMGTGRSKDSLFSQTGERYSRQIAANILTGKVYDDSFTSRAIERGKDREVESVLIAAEKLNAKEVKAIGEEQEFLMHPILRLGGTPDGLLLTDNGWIGVEAKNPNPDTHLLYLDKVTCAKSLLKEKPEYFWQCVANMLITGYDWLWFSHHPDFGSKKQFVGLILQHSDPFIRDSKIELGERVNAASNYIESLCNLSGGIR